MKVWGTVEIMVDNTKEVYDNHNNFEKEIRNFVERWDSRLISEDDDFGLDLLIEVTHLKEERRLSRFSFLSANLFR